MYKIVSSALLVFALGFSCAQQKPVVNKATKAAKDTKMEITKKPVSGIDLDNLDKSVRPQDDFYRYVNGGWLDKTEIPEDRSNYGVFTSLADESEKNLREIVEAAAAENAAKGSDAQKVGDFYKSYMDTTRIEALGASPLQEEVAKIMALKKHDQIAAHMLEVAKIGVQTPVAVFINQDAKNSTAYITYFHQSGLGLPDRDYYFSDNERFKEIRGKYEAYVEKMLTLAGQQNAATLASRIMRIETELAEKHWTRVKNRDRNLTYNKHSVTDLDTLMPNFKWSKLLEEAGLNMIKEVVVRQPDYFAALDKIFKNTPVVDWRNYLLFRLYREYASELSSEFVETHFDFYGRTLSGIEKNRPRWKRAIGAVDNTLGEITGRLYVEKHFKPAAKQRMEELVDNLILAFDGGIKGLEWMGEDTKKEALTKLGKFSTKIGYPDKWKDYSGLEINKEDLVGNYMRSSRFEAQREINKLGKPIDRSEWFMTPQTVNAYYNPPMNEIVFPAAILQPPFFNMQADDAVNYGAIGAVIGHEISHGFDDQGRKSDGDGNLRDWWSEADAEEFNKRSALMIEQYNQFNPIDTMTVNGELTLGENIGDLGGLTIAYKAYQLSLNGKPAPVIDGLTGDQRFFMGWAQSWRRKYRDEELRRRIMTDPHSPSKYRVNGIVANMPEFYQAFGVNEGDQLYRADNIRVKIW